MWFDYKAYREERYKTWWNSWAWSYWENALFKADIINYLIDELKVNSWVEVGCWDWHNLWLYNFKEYLWLDVSAKAIEKCKNIYVADNSKEFKLYEPWKEKQRDMSLCLDVTYHIFPRKEREETILETVRLWKKYVLFYSFLNPSWHVKHINDYDFKSYITDVCAEKWYDMRIMDKKPPKSESRFVLIIK